MKRFLKKSLFWIGCVVVLHLILGYSAGGFTDEFYVRFTTPRQQNLILGNSRAAQGIQPQFLESNNGKDFFNFSFTIFSSPFGQTYYESIQQKLDPNAVNGVFILSVDPWCLSTEKVNPDVFPEEKTMLGNTYFKNCNPNYEYLIKNYSKSWFNLPLDKNKMTKRKVRGNKVFLHHNGWLEVDIRTKSCNEYSDNVAAKLETYRGYKDGYSLSEERKKYFLKIIQFLKKHGDVYLVRIPVSEGMALIENEYMADFNSQMTIIAEQQNIPYLDFSSLSNDFYYTDGNHLQKDYGAVFTQMLNNHITRK